MVVFLFFKKFKNKCKMQYAMCWQDHIFPYCFLQTRKCIQIIYFLFLSWLFCYSKREGWHLSKEKERKESQVWLWRFSLWNLITETSLFYICATKWNNIFMFGRCGFFFLWRKHSKFTDPVEGTRSNGVAHEPISKGPTSTFLLCLWIFLTCQFTLSCLVDSYNFDTQLLFFEVLLFPKELRDLLIHY